MPEAVDLSNSPMNDRLKSTLWYHIGQLVDEETLNFGVNATPQYIGSLTELVWAQIGKPSCFLPRSKNPRVDDLSGNVATDLESFANHAGRNTIKTDDVLLLARRNEGLESILKQKIEEIRQNNEQKAKKKQQSQNNGC